MSRLDAVQVEARGNSPLAQSTQPDRTTKEKLRCQEVHDWLTELSPTQLRHRLRPHSCWFFTCSDGCTVDCVIEGMDGYGRSLLGLVVWNLHADGSRSHQIRSFIFDRTTLSWVGKPIDPPTSAGAPGMSN